jgi:hypothetical protein
MDSLESVLAIQNIQAYPRTFVNRTPIGIPNGTVKKKHIFASIGPDISGSGLRVEPLYGTKWHLSSPPHH